LYILEKYKKEFYKENINSFEKFNKFVSTKSINLKPKTLQKFYNENSTMERNMYLIAKKIYPYIKSNKKLSKLKKVDNTNFPLIGLHSTTCSALNKILKNGFNSEKGKIYGKTKNWPLAMFVTPFTYSFLNIEINNISGRIQQYIVLQNGIIRMLRANKKTFPIIIAGFDNSSIYYNDIKVKASYGHIDVYNNSSCIKILGIIIVSFSSEELNRMYREFKLTGETISDINMNFKIQWFI
jgi:hypothetical protein